MLHGTLLHSKIQSRILYHILNKLAMEKRKPLENIGNLVEISHKKTPAFLLVSSFI
ncbi:hypothetical protein STRINF_01698 [Streptococcus infantarius subsp. infantarius ATCC BAA-102]|uniref:Transposase n=1 Tax=Streptococcus infantarius subsp. infantarius ATCC BAA-102 TaxID=471872 RepID=A0ABM9XBW8_9STRE|nr:hypothetical protein STRINF_01698 [Streptococcus infantarius subsp. infantarius ATCC BAA-102]